MHDTGWSADLSVEISGRDVINHAGAAAVRLVADHTGLTDGLSPVAYTEKNDRLSARGERLFRQRDRPDPEVVMSFIDAHDFPAGLVLRVLGVPASTYYDWRARRESPSRRQLDDAALLEQIVKIRAAHEFAATYGSPRIWLELRRQGVLVGRKRVERLMREHGLQGAHLRRCWKTGSTRQNPSHTAAPDLVDRDFRAAAPNRLWVADLTRLVTGEGVLWLASVRDAFANRIGAGWATDPRAPPPRWCSPRSTTRCAPTTSVPGS